jgi:tRNA-splicing ligase RtcB
MPVVNTLKGGVVSAKIWTADLDEAAEEQLRNLSQLPIIFKHIAVMPDVHAGYGVPIGTIVACEEAILPSCVGVDIGCGMSAVRLPGLKGNDLKGRLKELRRLIEQRVPVGFNYHKNQEGLHVLHESETKKLKRGLSSIKRKAQERYPKSKLLDGLEKFADQMGTLGSGNHYIEICISDADEVWLMLHSGSRGVGNLIAQHYIALAKNHAKMANLNLPDRSLAYFTSDMTAYHDYINDMEWSQEFAKYNRRAMVRLILDGLATVLPIKVDLERLEILDCHHNYAAQEKHFGKRVWVARKGAIRARKGDLGIIPGSMGTKSFIVKGRGNPDSFDSCSHGAGRVMSRKQAKKEFDLHDISQQTAGVECRKDKGILDEVPGAYKDIEEVVRLQEDLIEVLHELKQVVCVKG